jgi:hypothetical protein
MGRVYGGAKPPKDEYRRSKAKRSMVKSQTDVPLAFYFKKTSCIMDSLYTHTHTHKSISTDGRTCSSSSSWPLCDEALDIVRRTSGKHQKEKKNKMIKLMEGG